VRVLSVASLMLMTLCAVPFARAAEVPYDAAAYDSAIKSGAPVAVVFHASWCPTCRAQAPVLKELAAEPKYKGLTLFVADFDKETALRQTLRVTKQSTLVVFNKGREVSRSTGETQRAGLDSALSSVAAGA
jgi:thioredoxin 1